MALVELLFIRAPLLLIPEPFKVSGLALVIVTPFKSSAAPLVKETDPDELPKAVALPSLNVPVLIKVPPL